MLHYKCKKWYKEIACFRQDLVVFLKKTNDVRKLYVLSLLVLTVITGLRSLFFVLAFMTCWLMWILFFIIPPECSGYFACTYAVSQLCFILGKDADNLFGPF